MIEQSPNSREEEIFSVARVIPTAGERRKYLDQVCVGDPQTRQAVEGLLEIYDHDESFLESPPPDLHRPESSDKAQAEQPGTMIGPYKILEVIGQGGMGNVYMAEQIEPVHRKVALKIIKSGMDSKSVIARFEAERQALALMDHPNIAKFYDAGMTQENVDRSSLCDSPSGHSQKTVPVPVSSDGSPYFVMELIMGRPIIEFCQQHKLDLKAKLELFSQVCNGVQHAHQKGIIHRDLKPSNVLVARYDDRPVAKVIDFGVAKAIGERLTDKTMYTRFGQLVGTLEYMSPEQAQLNQLDVDTRSDVYSLGAILYELLTGTPPFEKERLSNAALEEVLRMLREDEPDKPSTRLSKLSSVNLKADSNIDRKLARKDPSVPADLDWIVMKCLDKDRSRRYASANDVGGDIQRYLACEPVLAGPPSLAYRAQKFFNRNRTAVCVVVVVAATLLISTGISTWQAVIATQAKNDARAANDNLNQAISELEKERNEVDSQREKAEAEERRATKSLNWFVSTLQSPLSADRASVKVVDVLRDAAENAENEFEDDPIVAARLLQSVAETLTYLERGADAIPMAIRARELLKEKLGESHPEVWQAFYYVYWAYRKSPRFYQNRIQLFDQAYEIYIDHRQDSQTDDLAWVRLQLMLADLVTSTSKASLPADLGIFQRIRAYPLLIDALKSSQQWKNDPSMFSHLEQTLQTIGVCGDHETALSAYRDLLTLLLTRYDPSHVKPLGARRNIVALQSLGPEPNKAFEASHELVAAFETKFGPKSEMATLCRADHALIAARADKLDLANELIETAERESAAISVGSRVHLQILDKQVAIVLESGDVATAKELLDTRLNFSQGDEIVNATEALWNIQARFRERREDVSLELLNHFLTRLDGLDLSEDARQNLSDWIHSMTLTAAGIYGRKGEWDQAVKLHHKSLDDADAAGGLDSQHNALISLHLLFFIYYKSGNYPEALTYAKERLTRIREHFSDELEMLAHGYYWMGVASFWNKQYDQAVENFRGALETCQLLYERDYGRPFTIKNGLELFRHKAEEGGEQYLSLVANLTSSYAQAGMYEEAQELAGILVPFYLEIKDTHPAAKQLTPAFNGVGASYYVQAATTGDLSFAVRGIDLLEKIVPADRSSINTRDFVSKANAQVLSQIFILLNRYEQAAEILEVLVERERNVTASQRWRWAPILERFGYCHFKLGRHEKARGLLKEFLAVTPPGVDEVAEAMANHELGAVLIELGDVPKGEQLLLQGANELWEMRHEFEPHKRRYLSEALQRTIDHYLNKGEPATAKPWQDKLAEFEEAIPREPRP